MTEQTLGFPLTPAWGRLMPAHAHRSVRFDAAVPPCPPQPAVATGHGSRAERAAAAFREVPLSDVEMRVLRALRDNPGATGLQLSAACGWRGAIWQTHLAALCQRRLSVLWPDGDAAEPGAADCFLHGILADYNQNSRAFTMHADVAEALRPLLDRGARRQP